MDGLQHRSSFSLMKLICETYMFTGSHYWTAYPLAACYKCHVSSTSGHTKIPAENLVILFLKAINILFLETKRLSFIWDAWCNHFLASQCRGACKCWCSEQVADNARSFQVIEHNSFRIWGHCDVDYWPRIKRVHLLSKTSVSIQLEHRTHNSSQIYWVESTF